MNTTQVQEKIQNIENELEIMKRFFIKEPDLSIDEKNWKLVENNMKKIRKATFKKFYGKK